MAFGQGNQNALAPKWHKFVVKKGRFSGDDREIYCSVPERCDETRSRALNHTNDYLWESLRILNKRGTQIPGRNRCIEPNYETASFPATSAV